MSGTRFGFRAANENGAVVEGEIDAPSEQGAIDALRRRALWVTEVWPKHATKMRRTPRGVPAGALATSIRALSALLASGVTLDQALNYASTHAPAEQLRDAFAAVRADVRNGRALSDAFRAQHAFPSLFGALAATGESTGTLPEALARLAEHLEQSDEMRARMRAALLYPTLLGVAAVLSVTIIMLVVVPRFSVLLQQAGSTLPFSTRMLMGISSTLAAGWPIILAVAAISTLGWRRWVRNPGNRKRWHAARLGWPVSGPLERAMTAARYTRMLALAIPSGVDLLTAMRLGRGAVDNLAISSQLEEAEARVRGGSLLSDSLSSSLPALAIQMLNAGEAAGSLAPLSMRAADALDAEVQRSLSKAVTLVEPLLILGFGALIGFVALGLLQAIYGMNASTL